MDLVLLDVAGTNRSSFWLALEFESVWSSREGLLGVGMPLCAACTALDTRNSAQLHESAAAARKFRAGATADEQARQQRCWLVVASTRDCGIASAAARVFRPISLARGTRRARLEAKFESNVGRRSVRQQRADTAQVLEGNASPKPNPPSAGPPERKCTKLAGLLELGVEPVVVRRPASSPRHVLSALPYTG